MTATSLLDGVHIHPQTAGDSWAWAVGIRKFLSVILCCLLQYYLWPSISIVLVCHVYSIVIMVCTVTCTGEYAICINFYNGPTALKFSPLAKLQGFLASEPPPPSFVTILLIFFPKKQLGHLYDNKKWTHLHSWKQKCFQVWGALLPSEGCAWDPHYGLALANTRKFMPLEDNVKCVLYVLTCHVSVCMMYVCVHEYAWIYCVSNVCVVNSRVAGNFDSSTNVTTKGISLNWNCSSFHLASVRLVICWRELPVFVHS